MAELDIKSGRIQSLDVLRGIVMALMVLDHTRAFFFGSTPKPTDLAVTNGFLFFTRWITHFCAPVFVFLSGASAFMYGAKRSRSDSFRFLLSRGVWLVFLEFTVIRFGWFQEWSSVFVLQVIWAIGCSMILLGLCLPLGSRGILLVGALITVFHNGLSPLVLDFAAGPTLTMGQLLLTKGTFGLVGFKVIGAYAVVPWFGVMALGYGFGSYFIRMSPSGRYRVCIVLGVSAMAIFLVLRGFNIYGDPTAWQTHDSFAFTVMSFLNVTKYPPSLLYTLATLGPALVILPFLEDLRWTWAKKVFLIYGRVPMMFYIAHIYLVSFGAAGVALLIGLSDTGMKGVGASLGTTWLVWLVALAILLPLCRMYGEYKRSRGYWWLSYL